MRKTSPPYLIHSLNSQFHPTLILSIHPLTPISLLILPLFSPHSHPTISAYSLLSLLPYSLTAVSHPKVLSLKPRYCSPLSLTPLSLFTLSPHTNFSTISLTPLSSLSLTLFHTPLTPLFLNPFSLSLLSHPSFLSRFRNTLSSLSITLLITSLSFHSSFSSLFLTPLYFSLHSFTPLSLSFTKKSNPLYHPSLAPRSPSVTQHTLIPLSSLSLSSPSHPFLSPHSHFLTHSYSPHIPIFLILSHSYSSLLHLFFPPFSLSTLSYPTLSSLSLFHLSHLTHPTLLHYFLLIQHSHTPLILLSLTPSLSP